MGIAVAVLAIVLIYSSVPYIMERAERHTRWTDATVAEIVASKDGMDEMGEIQEKESDEAKHDLRQRNADADGAYNEQVVRLAGKDRP